MYEERKVQKDKSPFAFFSQILGSMTQFVFNTIEAVVIALALSIVFYLFIATPHQVIGRSMVPNFQNEEFLIGNKIGYKIGQPQRGDVIIFKYDENTDYIKRIIGMPNETVSIQNGKIHINNNFLDESEYLDPSIATRGGDFVQEGTTSEIPEGQYFVVGDNRPNSTDSRDFGPIEKSQIKGKAWLVYFPFSDFRLVKHSNINLDSQ